MYLRKATFTDLPRILEIIEHAKAALKNRQINQWQAGEPNQTQFEDEIHQELCYILMADQQVIGVASILATEDPGYAAITNGQWQSGSTPYFSIHRVALDSAFHGQHLGTQFLTLLVTAASLRGAHDLRIDTHPDNLAMQHMIQKVDFQYRGDIFIANDPSPKRYAYQLLLNQQ